MKLTNQQREILAEHCKKYRARHGLLQSDFAFKLGYTPTAACRLENPKYVVGKKLVQRAMDLLGIKFL